MVVAPWWLLVLVFMIFYPIIDIITGFVPPFSKAAEMGSKGVERSKTVFTIGFSLLAMFVTPLVPYVVQLVTVGTTFGVWWFWMLLFMMFIWGVNWLFGESPFGDPFRKGAAGLGHIGSAGMSKFKKAFREEMNDTTDEARFQSEIAKLMTLDFDINKKEKNMIQNIKGLLRLLSEAKDVRSSQARPILMSLVDRLSQLHEYISREDKLINNLIDIERRLSSINNKAQDMLKKLKEISKSVLIFANRNNLMSNYNSIKCIRGKTFPEYLKSLKEELEADEITDRMQKKLANKIQELNTTIKYNQTREELSIISSIHNEATKILQGRVTVHNASKFLSKANSQIWYLEKLETKNSELLLKCQELYVEYQRFLNKELRASTQVSNRVKILEAAWAKVQTDKDFLP
jgi:CHASE3 domain sensor protein